MLHFEGLKEYQNIRLLSFVEDLIRNENSNFYNVPLNILSIKLIGAFGQHESLRKGAG